MENFDQLELEKFTKLADQWWDPNGKFKPLHMLNPCRLDYIIEMIRTEFACDPAKVKPFSELTILDIGCGKGELLSMLEYEKNTVGMGVEISNEKVAEAVSKGISVIHGDADNDLENFPDKLTFSPPVNILPPSFFAKST